MGHLLQHARVRRLLVEKIVLDVESSHTDCTRGQYGFGVRYRSKIYINRYDYYTDTRIIIRLRVFLMRMSFPNSWSGAESGIDTALESALQSGLSCRYQC